jgi:hypothetical protein
MYRLSGPESLKHAEKDLMSYYRNKRHPSELKSVYQRLFEELENNWFFAPMVLKRLFSIKPPDVLTAMEALLDAYFCKDWPKSSIFSLKKNWRRKPEVVTDFIVIFAQNNKTSFSHPKFHQFLVDISKNRLLSKYLDSNETEFALRGLQALEESGELKRNYYGDRPYWNTLASLLYSKSTELINKSLSTLASMSSEVEHDSKFFVRYFSWKGLRKHKDVEKKIRTMIVSMGPGAVFALDYKTHRIELRHDDDWFKRQIALTAAEMTVHFPDPIRGAGVFDSWVLRHHSRSSRFDESYRKAMRHEVLYDVLSDHLGIKQALEDDLVPSFNRIERLKDSFRKSKVFDDVVTAIKKIGSPILERILEDYLKWSIGSLFDAMRTSLVVSQKSVIRGGLFPRPTEHAAFTKNYLETTPRWQQISNYLLTLGNETAIRIALDLIDNGLIHEYPLSATRIERTRERDYSQSLVQHLIILLKTSDNPKAIARIVRNARNLLMNTEIQSLLHKRGVSI